MQQRHILLAHLAALLCLAFRLPRCHGHAYLADPIARNWLHAHEQPTNFYDEMSLNHLGTGLCGGQRDSDSRFAVAPSAKKTADDGVMATEQITKTYTQGQEIKIRIHMSTSHWGRFELRLCPLSDASAATERRQFTEACLAAHPLYLSPKSYQAGITDPSKRYYYFTRADQTAKDVFATFILPKGVTCARCVMQWRWVTGNSCYAPGTLVVWKQSITYNIPECPMDYLLPKSQPEKFWNCADIAIRRAGPTPAPTKLKPTAPRPKPKVTVKKPVPKLTVKRPAPKPTVKKPARKPTVKKPAPKPTVKRPVPKATVKKPAPKVTVRKPAPTIKRPVPTVKKPVPTPAPTPRKTLTPTTPLPAAPTPTTMMPTPTADTPTTSAPTPVTVGGQKVAEAWQQCGGLWGNPAYGVDAEWPDTTCTAGTTCTRLSSDYYQCRV